MKKLGLALVFGIFSLGAVSAQTSQKAKVKTETKDQKVKQEGKGHKEHQDRSPEERAEMKANKLAKELNLTDAQKNQIREVTLAKAQRMDALKAQHQDNRKAMGTEMKEVKNTYETQLKDILTPDQYAKYEKERQEKMEDHKSHHGDQKKSESKTKK
jgi:protein CpxP